MSPGVADQLLLLIDEIEELTGEIFAAVQNQGTSDNLIDMLIKKDRKLATLLNTAEEQKHLYQKIENVSSKIGDTACFNDEETRNDFQNDLNHVGSHHLSGMLWDSYQTVFDVLIFISVGDYKVSTVILVIQYKKEIVKYDEKILRFQQKLLEAENMLLPVLYQGMGLSRMVYW